MPKIKEEEYIINESQEIALTQNPLISTFFQAFPALKHRNYRLYFIGQLLSLVGTWIQIVALGWLVFQLTKSAFMVGLVSSLGSLPILIFGLFGGVIVDRFAKKKILIFTQISSMILAFILGFLTISGVITVLQIIILAFLAGLISALICRHGMHLLLKW
ncbi:MAG: MFS transporter [Candidatus Levybacteria bacterium]|nr:MFS transporter [Candidatus Levybacteria bacterium]